jgi:hypothetical protein
MIRVRMYPDVSDWTFDDIRYIAGYGGGLYKDHCCMEDAVRTYNDCYELGFTVVLELLDTDW